MVTPWALINAVDYMSKLMTLKLTFNVTTVFLPAPGALIPFGPWRPFVLRINDKFLIYGVYS